MLITTALFLLPISALALLNHSAIAFGVFIGPYDAHGTRISAIQEALAQKTQGYLHETFELGNSRTRLKADPAQLGVRIDVEKTISNALAVGRKGGLFARIIEQVHTALFNTRIPMAASINDVAFETYFRAHLEPLEHKAREAGIAYNEEKELFELSEERIGSVIDASKLKYELLRVAAKLETKNIAIAMIQDTSFIRKEMVEPLMSSANEILAQAPFTLTYATGENSDTSRGAQKTGRSQIEKGQLKDFLTVRRVGNHVELGINESELRNFLVGLAPTINKKPRNAVLAVAEGKVTEFVISKSGIELDADTSMPRVRDGLLKKERAMNLAVNILLPEVRTETIENLGLVSLIGEGESDFAGSPASRAFNVKLGAKKMNGVLIKSNEEFSFINAIGEVDPKEGWRAGLVIKGKDLVPEYGGGLCQVSTTMFRAAMYSGLPITERFGHSLPVLYYNPQGFDATVYGPHPDFRFVNDTPSNILVQTRVKGTKLYFEFYGTPDGREVKLEGPVEYDKKPDGSLKAILTREIYKDGEAVKKDVFRSTYRSPKKEPQQRNPLE